MSGNRLRNAETNRERRLLTFLGLTRNQHEALEFLFEHGRRVCDPYSTPTYQTLINRQLVVEIDHEWKLNDRGYFLLELIEEWTDAGMVEKEMLTT